MVNYEVQARKKGFRFVIGIDEAGRGPLAGPVVASAVFIKQKRFSCKIRDSKKLTASQREEAYLEIFDRAYVGIGIVNETTIDSLNILNATYGAMSLSVRHLTSQMFDLREKNDFEKGICLLIDGNSFKSSLPYHFQTIIKGDDLCFSIACASIIAKVTRDRILTCYDRIFPQYGFCQHKGYATKAHQLAIKEHGLSCVHRKSFQLKAGNNG